MLDAARTLLRQTFGFADFHPRQAEVIAAILAGHDALVLMPTGGGKSLCYQIPSLLLNGTGIIISPLIALMQNQVLALRQAGIRAEHLNSSLDRSQQQAVERKLRAGQLDLLYIAPERLLFAENPGFCLVSCSWHYLPSMKHIVSPVGGMIFAQNIYSFQCFRSDFQEYQEWP